VPIFEEEANAIMEANALLNGYGVLMVFMEMIGWLQLMRMVDLGWYGLVLLPGSVLC